ncbi:MAG TPA: hypothetical protein VH540_21410 [Ktedonobacterales bacterium]
MNLNYRRHVAIAQSGQNEFQIILIGEYQESRESVEARALAKITHQQKLMVLQESTARKYFAKELNEFLF